MAFRKMSEIFVGADYGLSQIPRGFRRGRFIAPIADLSAFRSHHDIPLILLISIMNNKKAPSSIAKDDDACCVYRGATLILSIHVCELKLTMPDIGGYRWRLSR
jgi:hypothetical protein